MIRERSIYSWKSSSVKIEVSPNKYINRIGLGILRLLSRPLVRRWHENR